MYRGFMYSSYTHKTKRFSSHRSAPGRAQARLYLRQRPEQRSEVPVRQPAARHLLFAKTTGGCAMKRECSNGTNETRASIVVGAQVSTVNQIAVLVHAHRFLLIVHTGFPWRTARSGHERGRVPSHVVLSLPQYALRWQRGGGLI